MAIDRRSLVRRHNPVIRGYDPFSPLSVGNGEFAFTVDITGLQSLISDMPCITPLYTTCHNGDSILIRNAKIALAMKKGSG